MSEQVRPPTALRILDRLRKQADMQHQTVPAPGLSTEMVLLRAWQSARLQRTYADFLNNPNYAPACRFFQDEIYAPRDFSQRDHDVERLYGLLLRFVPEHMLSLVKEVIELNRLSNRLDAELLHVLVHELGLGDQISAEVYAEGYRRCGNYDERRDQIECIVSVSRQVAEGARNPLVFATLRAAREPARRAGWQELQGFLEHGCQAFRKLRDVDLFIAAIRGREFDVLERIYAGEADCLELTMVN